MTHYVTAFEKSACKPIRVPFLSSCVQVVLERPGPRRVLWWVAGPTEKGPRKRLSHTDFGCGGRGQGPQRKGFGNDSS